MATFLKESYFDGKNGTHFKQSLYYDISQDIANNTSTITYYGYVGSVDGYSGSGNTATVYINGSSVGTFTSLSSYSSGTLRGTKTETIYHNSDGTASASYSMTTDTPWTLGDSSLSGSFTLPTIPRKANLTSAQDFTDEGNPTITYTNSAGNSVSSLQARIENTSGNVVYAAYRDVGKTAGSYTFNLTTNERNALRQACTGKTMTVRFNLKTVIGGTTYNSTINKTLSITNANPVVTVSAVDTNKSLDTGITIQDLTGDTTNKTIVKGLSNVTVSLTASAQKYATITSTQITAGTGEFVTYSGDFNYTFNNATTNSFTGKAVDSRTNSTEIPVSDITMLDYIPLSISPVRLYRTNQTGSDLYAEIDGNYFDDDIGQVTNSLTLKFKYKESGSSTWSSWTTITPTISNNIYSFDGLIGNNFDYTKIYDFVFQVEDVAMIKTNNVSSTPGIPVVGIFEDIVELFGEEFASEGGKISGELYVGNTGKKLKDLGGGDSTPIGTIAAFSGSSAPDGYLLCDGSAVSRTTYADLFTAIGTTYGTGDGSTTFNLPNLKGRTVVMQDTSQTEFDTLGETGGSKTVTLNANQMPAHSHEVRWGNNNGSYVAISADGSGTRSLDLGSWSWKNSQATSRLYTNVQGSGQAHNNLQPYIVLNYIIKAFNVASTPSTSQVKNVYTDSLTDVYGCEYVNENFGELIWSNIGFISMGVKNVAGNFSNYNSFKIGYFVDSNASYILTKTGNKGTNINLTYSTNYSRQVAITNNNIAFGDGYYNGSINSNAIIPAYIIGYK